MGNLSFIPNNQLLALDMQTLDLLNIFNSYDKAVLTPEVIELSLDAQNRTALNGENFTYTTIDGKLAITGGTITSITMRIGDTSDTIDITGLSLSASQFGDVLLSGSGDLFELILDGNDTIGGASGDDVLYGYNGGDDISGFDGADVIYGGAGDDTLDGGLGNDRLIGGDGVDILNGGDGNDVLIDRFGATNTFNGGSGEDRIVSGGGDDSVSGGSERDVIKTFGGADEINGDDGDDVILSGDGDDIVYGGNGNDVIKTSLGNDIVYGGDGNDIIYGWRGDDELYGGAGDDVIRGDFDGDIIEGGAGNDRLVGAPGRDTFIFREGFEEDRILDFTDRSDLLDFSQHTGVDGIDDLSMSQVGTNVVITDGLGGRVVLAETDLADITEEDFVFAIV